MVESQSFRSSPALRRLLSYLAEKTLAGEAEALKEYTVAVEALGKPETYDPRQDSSVRFQTSKLRQRLTEYYRTGGGNDPVQVDFPPGRFELVFTHRDAGGGSGGDAEARKWRWIALTALSALVAVMVAAIYFGIAASTGSWGTKRSSTDWSSDLAEIWSPFLTGDRPVLVAIGTPLFVHYRTAFVRAPGLNDWESVSNSEMVAGLTRFFRPNEPRAYYNFTGVGDAAGAFELARLLAPRTSHLSLTRTIALSWDDIGVNNMIFIGPPKFNLKLNEISASLEQDFRIERYGIRNLRPAPGEPAFFGDGNRAPDVAEGLSGEAHALISRLPGLHENGEILILAGNWTSGTQAAVEYLARPTYARDLVRKLHALSETPPAHYEVVIKVRFRQGSPVQIWPVAHHIRKPGRRLKR